MSNYKLKKIIANKINESSIGFNIQEEYGMRYELEKYEDQIKLEYGPQTFRDLQLKVQENREEEVAEWLEKNNFIKPETTEFHEGIVRSQIKKILKETPNSFQGGKPFVRRSDQDHHDAQDSLKEYSEDYIVVYDKTLKKVIKKFINNKDGYYSGRSKARRFVDDMVKSSDTPFDNLSNYEIGKETEYRSMEESVNEVADPSALELVGALSTIIGGSLGIKFGMDLLNKIVDKALAAAKYNATEILKIVKDNTAPLKAAAQEGKRAFIKKLMSLIINPTTTTSDYLDRIPKDPPFTIKRNEGTCGYDTDARTGKRFKTPGGL